MSMEERLSEIYKAENELYNAERGQEQDWPGVFGQYRELYRLFPVQEVAIHFAFFCWYLLWQWDELEFPGEALLFHERAALEARGGMSKAEVYSCLNRMAVRLLSPEEAADDRYLAILIHMRNIYPYFFESSVLSDELADRILAHLESRQDADPFTKRICLYRRFPDKARATGGEDADGAIIPSDGSLVSHYFQWLFMVEGYLGKNGLNFIIRFPTGD